MKKALLTFGLFACSIMITNAQDAPAAAQAPANPNAAEIKFENETIDYGTIENGSDGAREFKFKNVGKEPLIISNAQGSCGCTVPTWPKEPIKPGASGSIKVTYDTKRTGTFEKTVTITSNAKNSPKVIHIKGNVKPAAEAPVPAPGAPAGK
jgi:hypothetical protein